MIGIYGNGFFRFVDIFYMVDEDKRGLFLKVLKVENVFIEFELDI